VDFKYPRNLNFECNRCALCCGDTKHKIRHILLLESEAKKISSETSLLIPAFSTKVTGQVPYSYEMKKTSDGKCLFLKDNQCIIYSYRPLICVFYPFELRFNECEKVHTFDFTLECPGISQGQTWGEQEFKKLFELAQEKLQ